MEQYTRQLNRISKAINEIPYNYVYIEIQTETDKFILEKNKKSRPIGFKGGV